MATVTKSYAIANILQGPCDAYANITAPGSHSPPTADVDNLTLDGTGQPTSATGISLGSLEGPSTIQITEKVNEIHDDAHESPIAVGFDSIEAEIDIAVKETTLTRLQTLLNAGGLGVYTALGNSKAWQLGGQFDSSIAALTLLLVSPDRSTAGKFIYVFCYRCYLKSAIAMSFQRSKETVYKLKFGCVCDLTRVAGDELMQIVRTK